MCVCVCLLKASKAQGRSGDERREGTKEAELKLMVWEKDGVIGGQQRRNVVLSPSSLEESWNQPIDQS